MSPTSLLQHLTQGWKLQLQLLRVLGTLYIHMLYQDFAPFGGTPASDLCIVAHDSQRVPRQKAMDTLFAWGGPCSSWHPAVTPLCGHQWLPSLHAGLLPNWLSLELCGQLGFFSACRPHRLSSYRVISIAHLCRSTVVATWCMEVPPAPWAVALAVQARSWMRCAPSSWHRAAYRRWQGGNTWWDVTSL